MGRAQRSVVLLDYYSVLDPFYKELGGKLARAYSCLYHVTTFASPNLKKGFRRHRDHDHLFVFQQQGKTAWQVFDLDGKLVMNDVLEPGDVLYVPMFFEHQAQRLTDEELHVSLSFQYADRVMGLTALRFNPVLRQTLPEDDNDPAVLAINKGIEMLAGPSAQI